MAEEEKDKKSKANNTSLIKALLDSSLISQINKKLYNIRLFKCGNTIQLYKYKETRMKTDESYCPITRNDREGVEEDSLPSLVNEQKEIRGDNAMRSKLSIERLIKANEKEFKTFITLTFAENISNIELANKKFNNWRTKIKKVYPNLKYVCVPEYQKRGAVHYHLITNIPLKGSIITLQKDKINQYDVPYWDNGFTSVFEVNKTNNVCGYMSKYMTKDIDNRLFSKKKYFYSMNLNVPKAEYLNTNDNKAIEYINNLIQNKVLSYTNLYYNKYINDMVEFNEYNSYNTYYVNLYLY